MVVTQSSLNWISQTITDVCRAEIQTSRAWGRSSLLFYIISNSILALEKH